MAGLVFVGDESNEILDKWMTENTKFTDATFYVEALNNESKGGLGFTETENKKSTLQNKNSINKIDQKKNNKKHRSVDYDDDLHGVVEDIEESRTACASKNSKVVTKTIVSKVTQVNPHPKIQNKIADVAKIDESLAAEAEETEKAINNRKRKRVKTRSKQKNIRRDNRAELNKPAHLQLGSKEYCGRPLTEQTKSILGVK